MKHLLKIIVPTLLLLCALGTPALAQGRVATIDLSKVFDGYWKTKQARAALEDRANDLTKEHTNLRSDLKKAGGEYQKLLAEANDQAVSADERAKRKTAAEAKYKDMKDTEETIVQFSRQAEATLGEQRRRMRENILTEIRTAVTAKAKAAGYALVVDVSAESVTASPVVLFNNGENDITETILAQLNAAAPLDTPKPAEKTTEKK